MRKWIDLMEARRKPAPVVDHAARAKVVYDLVMRTAANLSKTHFDFRKDWDQTWARMIQKGIAQARIAHDKEQQQEVEHYGNTPVPFVVLDVLPDVTARWWEHTVKDALFTLATDAKHAYEYYLDSHPNTESSDEMSVLHAQFQMARNLEYKASDTIEGMTETLRLIDNYVDDSMIRYTHDDLLVRSAQDFIKAALPAFLTICKYMGAKA